MFLFKHCTASSPLLVTLGASAGQITHEQLVKINKFNKDWTNILAMENKGVAMKIQQHNTLRTCRTVFKENHKAFYFKL
jgi:hypothetical protein